MKYLIALSLVLVQAISLKSIVPTYTVNQCGQSFEEFNIEYETALNTVKMFESVRLKSYWDVNHWAIGWGTHSYESETITLAEADRRIAKEFNRTAIYVSEKYPHLSSWSKLVLTSMKYNVSGFGEQLNAALQSSDLEKAAQVMGLYVHDANGNKLKGLVDRRNVEANLLAQDKEGIEAANVESIAVIKQHIKLYT